MHYFSVHFRVRRAEYPYKSGYEVVQDNGDSDEPLTWYPDSHWAADEVFVRTMVVDAICNSIQGEETSTVECDTDVQVGIAVAMLADVCDEQEDDHAFSGRDMTGKDWRVTVHIRQQGAL